MPFSSFGLHVQRRRQILAKSRLRRVPQHRVKKVLLHQKPVLKAQLFMLQTVLPIVAHSVVESTPVQIRYLPRLVPLRQLPLKRCCNPFHASNAVTLKRC